MREKLSRILIYLFFTSIIVFLCFAIIAMLKYPGRELGEESFDLLNHYWCDLYKGQTPSGKLNGAMLFAKLGTLSAAIGFSAFWIVTPMHYIPHKWRMIVTQVFGVAALALAAFLFTGYHDLIISVGSLFGFIALVSLVVGLRQHGLISLYWLGMIAILLLVLCNLVLLVPSLFFTLPALQKIALLLTMMWSVLVANQILKSDLSI